MIVGEAARSFVLPANWLDEESRSYESLTPGFLLLVTLLAAALRFFALAGQSLWVDELFTWRAVQPHVGLSFLEQMLDTIQGPLYHAAVWPLVRLQDGAFMLRLPAAILGTLTVPLFGVITARIFDLRTARLAALLLAVSPFHVWYSQEARGYAFLIFFSLAAAALYLRMLREGPGPTTALLFGLLTAAAVWSNMGGLFVWLALGATLLLYGRPRGRRAWLLWSLGFGLALLLAMPWILKASGIWAVDRIVPGAATGVSLRGETTFSLAALPYTIYTFFFGYSLGPSLRALHQPDQLAVIKSHLPVLVVAMVPVGAALLSGVLYLGRRRSVLLWWIAIPAAILVLLAMRNIKPWNPRYISMVLPWFLAVAAFGLVRLPRRAGLILTVWLLALNLWALTGHYFDDDYAKADIRGAAQYLATANTANDPVLVPAVSSVYVYYAGDAAKVLPAFGALVSSAAEADVFVVEQFGDRQRGWIVLGREWFFDPRDLLPAALSRAGHLRLEHTGPGVRVYAWQAVGSGEQRRPTP